MYSYYNGTVTLSVWSYTIITYTNIYRRVTNSTEQRSHCKFTTNVTIASLLVTYVAVRLEATPVLCLYEA